MTKFLPNKVVRTTNIIKTSKFLYIHWFSTVWLSLKIELSKNRGKKIKSWNEEEIEHRFGSVLELCILRSVTAHPLLNKEGARRKHNFIYPAFCHWFNCQTMTERQEDFHCECKFISYDCSMFTWGCFWLMKACFLFGLPLSDFHQTWKNCHSCFKNCSS